MSGRPGSARAYFDSVLAGYDGDDCIAWPFSKTPKGYGKMWFEGRLWLVSRLLCIQEFGPPPTVRHHASHLCGNGHLGCVNRHHLTWMTAKENEHQKKKNGTYHLRGGVENLFRDNGARVNAKLTEEQVVEIITCGTLVSPEDFADKFDVTVGAIRAIQSGRNWRRVYERVHSEWHDLSKYEVPLS